jgi:hypothetical protein
MNCYSERFVRSVKEECLSKLIFFGEESLKKTIVEYGKGPGEITEITSQVKEIVLRGVLSPRSF